MKHSLFYLPALCLALIAISCNKKDGTGPTTQPPVPDTTNNKENKEFRINGVADITLTIARPVDSMILEVAHLSGDPKTISLFFSGLPEGITPTFSAASGTPPFETSVRFISNGLVNGSFPAKLHASGNTASSEYAFNLHVERSLFCLRSHTGTYRNTHISCWGDGSHDLIVTERVRRPGQVEITYSMSKDTDGRYQDITFYAEMNCLRSQIIIPPQTNSLGKPIQGQGYFGGYETEYDYLNFEFTTTDEHDNKIECKVRATKPV